MKCQQELLRACIHAAPGALRGTKPANLQVCRTRHAFSGPRLNRDGLACRVTAAWLVTDVFYGSHARVRTGTNERRRLVSPFRPTSSGSTGTRPMSCRQCGRQTQLPPPGNAGLGRRRPAPRLGDAKRKIVMPGASTSSRPDYPSRSFVSDSSALASGTAYRPPPERVSSRAIIGELATSGLASNAGIAGKGRQQAPP